MRTFAECKKIYETLYHADFEGTKGKDFCVTALRIKWLSSVAHFLYPTYYKNVHQYHLTDEGKVMDGSVDIEDAGDYLLQACLINGEVADYALCYMKHSPFWDISYDYAQIKSTDEYGMDEEMNEVEMEPADFLKGRFGCFMEDVFEKDMDVLKSKELQNLFDMYVDGEVTDEICAIKSELFPYVEKAKAIAGNECKEMIDTVDEAFKTIRSWQGISEVHFDTPKAGYFFASDESSDIYEGWYGTYGALDFDPSVIICGELIEAALFEIHERYPFLPEHILKRRMKNYG